MSELEKLIGKMDTMEKTVTAISEDVSMNTAKIVQIDNQLTHIAKDVARLNHEFFGKNGDISKSFFARFVLMERAVNETSTDLKEFIINVRKGAVWVIGLVIAYVIYLILDHVTAGSIIETIKLVVTATPHP